MIAGIVLAVGLILAMAPTSISLGEWSDVGCGSAIDPSTAEAGARDYGDRLSDALGGGLGVPDSDYVARCEARVSTQRLVAFPPVGVGGLVLLFVWLTGQHRTRWDVESPADEGVA